MEAISDESSASRKRPQHERKRRAKPIGRSSHQTEAPRPAESEERPLPTLGELDVCSRVSLGVRETSNIGYRRAAFGCIRRLSGAAESENPGKEAVCV